MGYTGSSFNSAQEITFGAGANETPLTEENADELRELVSRLFARAYRWGRQARPALSYASRSAGLRACCGGTLSRWMLISTRSTSTRRCLRLRRRIVGCLDLLGVTDDGRLAVIELKADEDLHLALQGLDYLGSSALASSSES